MRVPQRIGAIARLERRAQVTCFSTYESCLISPLSTSDTDNEYSWQDEVIPQATLHVDGSHKASAPALGKLTASMPVNAHSPAIPPPSITKSAPVTQRASSEARYRAQ